MKHVLLLIPIFMLTAVLGCSERGYVAPHIVSIDPPIQEFTKEEMLELASKNGPLPIPLPRRYVHLNRGEYATVTVTFLGAARRVDRTCVRLAALDRRPLRRRQIPSSRQNARGNSLLLQHPERQLLQP